MAVDYRLDPFQDVLNPVTISGETHTIPSVSPFSIRLAEVPLKETPSSISLTIGGYTATEVSSQPAAGEFWPDYSTGADGDESWNTGTILFNASDAGKTVVVAYKGTGTLVDARLAIEIFTESGMATAPAWATKALISGCGGGGGGGAGTTTTGMGQGWTGGVTSFDSLLSLGGGVGGYRTGQPGAASSDTYLALFGGGTGTSAASGVGGHGPFGEGGISQTTIGNSNNDGIGYGSGGGGARTTTGIGGGGGGTGGACIDYLVDIVGGKTYEITIGAGGVAGVAYYAAGNGAPGLLIIKWVA